MCQCVWHRAREPDDSVSACEPNTASARTLCAPELWFTCRLLTTELVFRISAQKSVGNEKGSLQAGETKRSSARASWLLCFRGQELFGGHWSLGLPQVAVDGDRIDTGRQCFSGYVAELLPVRIVFVKPLDHFFRDRFRAYPSQFINLFSFWTVSIQRPELTA